jgi:hypothetical protein
MERREVRGTLPLLHSTFLSPFCRHTTMAPPPTPPRTPTTPTTTNVSFASCPVGTSTPRRPASAKPLHAQQREVDAWHQTRRNNQVLEESRKTATVSRKDHLIMVRILVAEAYQHDANRIRNKEKWKKMVEDVKKEFRGSSMFAVGPDPYNSCLSKLSSMMLWNTENVRVWPLKYNENEMTRRRAAQLVVLSQLRARKVLFL